MNFKGKKCCIDCLPSQTIIQLFNSVVMYEAKDDEEKEEALLEIAKTLNLVIILVKCAPMSQISEHVQAIFTKKEFYSKDK